MPNPSLNADVPYAGLRLRNGPPVSLSRLATQCVAPIAFGTPVEKASRTVMTISNVSLTAIFRATVGRGPFIFATSASITASVAYSRLMNSPQSPQPFGGFLSRVVVLGCLSEHNRYTSLMSKAWPNPAVNTEAPRARLRRRSAPPVTLVR